ncbi:hypothetical protein [Arsukibacterium sp.]|uniref:hypothetical protein n=1 Tax=Arsukibacterium sp. TaxID=1977258 RepID=UPI001BD1E1FF|nr:hypothetical protein [Arsukibacterium sp.]
MKAAIGLVLILTVGCAGLPAENETEEVVARQGKDQALIIQLATNGCVEEVRPPVDDNCRDPGETIRAGCGRSRDCACAARGKNISWQVVSSPSVVHSAGVSPELPDFSIIFTGYANPFKSDCKLKAKAGGIISCKIDKSAKDYYDYEVKVSSCLNDYDPRIVIRNFLN